MTDISPKDIKITLDILREIALLNDKLLSYNIVRSQNSPLGDFAEYVTCLALNLKPENSAGYDAISQNNHKYEIKSRTVDTVRIDGDLIAFDFFVALFFTKKTYKLKAAFLVPRDILKQIKNSKRELNDSRYDRLYLSLKEFRKMVHENKAENITDKYIDILGDNIENFQQASSPNAKR